MITWGAISKKCEPFINFKQKLVEIIVLGSISFFFVMITTREVSNWRFWSLFHHLNMKQASATKTPRRDRRFSLFFPEKEHPPWIYVSLPFPTFPYFSLLFHNIPTFPYTVSISIYMFPPPRIRTPLYLNVYVFVTFWGGTLTLPGLIQI